MEDQVANDYRIAIVVVVIVVVVVVVATPTSRRSNKQGWHIRHECFSKHNQHHHGHEGSQRAGQDAQHFEIVPCTDKVVAVWIPPQGKSQSIRRTLCATLHEKADPSKTQDHHVVIQMAGLLLLFLLLALLVPERVVVSVVIMVVHCDNVSVVTTVAVTSLSLSPIK